LIITLSRKKKKKRSKKKDPKKDTKKKSFLVIETVTANGKHPIVDPECPSVIHGPPLQFHEVTPGNGFGSCVVDGGVGVVGVKFVTVYNFGVRIALVSVKVIGTVLVRRLDVVEVDRDRSGKTIVTNGTIVTNTIANTTIATIAIIIGGTVKGNKPPLELEVTPGEVTPGKVTPGKVTPGEVTPGEVTPGEVSGVGGFVEIAELVEIIFVDVIGVDIITEYVIVIVRDVAFVVDGGFSRGVEDIRAVIAIAPLVIVRTAIARTTFIEVYGGDFLSSRDGVGESESR